MEQPDDRPGEAEAPVSGFGEERGNGADGDALPGSESAGREPEPEPDAPGHDPDPPPGGES